MPNKLSFNDFVDPSLIKGFQDLQVTLQKLEAQFKELKGMKAANPDSFNKLNKALKEEEKLITRLDKEQKQLNQSTSQAAKEISKLQQQRRKNNELLKQTVKFQNSAKGSIDRLNAANAIARQKLRSLNLETEKGRIAAQKLKAVIDKNTIAIQKNSDAMTRQKMNIGNYASSIRQGMTAAAGAVMGVVFAFRAVTNAVSGITKAYDTQITAEKALEKALGGNARALKAQASEIQKRTRYGDEAIIQGQAFLAQMGVTEDQILKLTPAIIDMAAAQKMDLESAFKLTAKSLGSSTNALGRYGVTIEGAVGSNERLESAIVSLNDKFEGQAEAAMVGTATWEQLNNTWGDTQELLGRMVLNMVGSGGLNQAIGQMNEGLSLFIDIQDKSNVAWYEMFTNIRGFIEEQKRITGEWAAEQHAIVAAGKAIKQFNEEGRDLLKMDTAKMSSIIATTKGMEEHEEAIKKAIEAEILNEISIKRTNEARRQATIDKDKNTKSTKENTRVVIENTRAQSLEAKASAETVEKIMPELILQTKELSDVQLAALDAVQRDKDEREKYYKDITDAAIEANDRLLDHLSKANEMQLKMIDERVARRDQEISELNEQINQEIALNQTGAAADIGILQTQLRIQQQAREQDLKEKERIQKRELALDLIKQASDLATAIAGVYSQEGGKLGVPGLIIATAGVAGMLASFAAFKAQARSLGTGGVGDEYGVVDGKYHNADGSGGERLLDWVNVEKGERFGVLNRTASNKYGSEFYDIVRSMNDGDFDAAADGHTIIIKKETANSRHLDLIAQTNKLLAEIKNAPNTTIDNGKIVVIGSNFKKKYV